MANGDPTDMIGRLRAVLPARWFPDNAPLLDGVLAGFASAYAWVYDLITYAQLQSRISSATDAFLDLAAADYLGARLPRHENESDEAYRRRVRREILRPRATRAALVAELRDLTGHEPLVFEPNNPSDTGGLNTGSLGYGVAGGYGSALLAHQCFVTAYRPTSGGIAFASGWDNYGGGYGVGGIQYASVQLAADTVRDEDIYAAVASTIAAATIAWVRITHKNTRVPDTLDYNFVLDASELT